MDQNSLSKKKLITGNNNKIFSNPKNGSDLGTTSMNVPDMNSHLLSPFRNKPSKSTNIKNISDLIINTAQNKINGKRWRYRIMVNN